MNTFPIGMHDTDIYRQDTAKTSYALSGNESGGTAPGRTPA